MSKTVKGYAKINLHLDITKKRDDGYHDIESVMQSVSLFDSVTVSLTDGDFGCSCNVEGVPQDDKNIALKAARLYAETVGYRGGVFVEIDKGIPMAAGLAGGSADAAATLVAMNELWNNRMSLSELCALGAYLGADVPFCIRGGAAHASGIGDILTDFHGLPKDTVLVIACGGEGVSTPWGYGLLDKQYNDFKAYTPRGCEGLREALFSRDGDKIGAELFNIFESVVLSERPVAAKLKRIMTDAGAVATLMSGSGPSVFGIFDDIEDAELALRVIRSNDYFAEICRPL